MSPSVIRLRPREDRRLRAGHLWVFSNEIDCDATPLTAFAPGDPVRIESAHGRCLGVGYVNPRSLISVRIVSTDPRTVIGRDLFVDRLQQARAWRERVYASPFYRLVFGEADGLPGLVVDRYDDVLVAQFTTAGMERLKGDVVEALDQVIRPTSILVRNDTSSRALEGLPSYVEAALGEPPEEVTVIEGSCRFRVALRAGQKTGWFYDQRPNRARLLPYVARTRVLDLFSYVGGFGIQAAAHGASHATLVDASEQALSYARGNAADNGVASHVATVRGDVFEVLRELRDGGERFDVVIVDPPALIKRRKDYEAGLAAYQRLNESALAVLGADGVLLSASCSYHLERQTLSRVVASAATRLRRGIQFVDEGGQGPDHPIHPAIPETAYLKAFVARSLSTL
ncbi:class I SAM-dependent rRNA methyltransferase [Acidiferrobacter sp.]|jgi:23S rRNA (cytosine1962-C5)-methyltransferase|uniref:class I SAM-dependent rRNA methyltransferase n=1 Tax=Acidiferrobacter sp. TaxID=1872107 RepID=UPI002612ED43|nr:class I SAM-dependent rRNA methyltransferase [Acidiferrobacter sp.]